jgi:hypothetical protein
MLDTGPFFFLKKEGLIIQLSVATSSSHEIEKYVQILASNRKAKKKGYY